MDDSGQADRFLVEQIQQGSEGAWRQLIDRYSGRLLAFARTRAPSLTDAEDLTQETFVGFLQSLHHFDATRSLETYLFTILRYKLYDHLRQRKDTVLVPPAEDPGWWEDQVQADSETPSGIAARAEAGERQERLLVELLRELIRELRDRQAFHDLQVIELIFYKGMRNLDVAELLEVDQKAVAGIKFRAIQRLQKFLGEKDAAETAVLAEGNADVTVARAWRQHRLTCLKRSTLGAYVLDVLEDPWRGYVQFHLDVIGCPMCVANLEDLEAEQEDAGSAEASRFFQSSVGFLSGSAARPQSG